MALVRSWQAETRRHGPQVILLQPPPVATALRARFFPGEDKSRRADLRSEGERLVSLL